MPLSFLATLLRCHEYDVELNIWLSQRRQKHLSATEVARRLVSSTVRGVQDDKVMSKQTETKRQILGVARKLPVSTVDYLRDFMCNDDGGLQVAFTLANLRAIPKRVTAEECLMLVKRFIRYYQDCLPSPKPLLPKDVSTQLVQIRRAIKELEKFKTLCDYDEIPNEMTTIAERMTCTQLLDIQMQEHAFSKHLIQPLETACRNLVPNGTNHLEIARKRLQQTPQQSSEHSDLNKHPAIDSDTDLSSPGASENGSSKDSEEEGFTAKACLSSHSQYSGEPSEQNNERPVESIVEAAPLIEASQLLPVGWKIVHATLEDFMTQHDEWKMVQGKADMVMTVLQDDESNEDCLKQVVRHCGMAMKQSGVCYIVCNYIHFSKLFSVVCAEGMEMMKHPMLYIQDPSTIKRKTLSQHPQESGFIAAVFWRSPDRRQKHHYSYAKGYRSSTLPSWVNCVTNVQQSQNPLCCEQGKILKVRDIEKDLSVSILEQWCKPAGTCYNPRAGSMSMGLACLDLGIQYIALEHDSEIFGAAKRRLVASVQEQAFKRRKLERCTRGGIKETNNEMQKEGMFCGIGEEHCRFPGSETSFSCKSMRRRNA